MTTEEFIAKARAIHGDKYDYSKVEYVNNKTKVCIICPLHGEFWQTPSLHLAGSNCPICAGKAPMKTPHFIRKAQLVHGNKYDYSQTIYLGRLKQVDIICPIHGLFSQRAVNHLSGHGCPKCGTLQSSSQQKIWTKQTCYSEAKKYTTVGDFCKLSKSAYVIAVRCGWLQDYTWLSRKKVANGFWTKERVFAEAKKYTERKDFIKQSPGAYNAAQKLGMMSELKWFPAPKNAKKWNRESCYKEAQKYRSKTDFRKKSIVAYCIARDNGWLADYDWFVPPEFLWNHEKCIKVAKRFEYYADFRTSEPTAYMAARKRGWLPEYTWLIKEHVEVWNKKWNYDTCYAEAEKYKTKGEFGKKGKGAYEVARRNGWLSDYTWFPDFTDSDAKVDSVYRYYFQKYKAIYVGRTLMYRQHLRDVEHRKQSCDAVLRFAQEHNCIIPPMEILENNLTIQEGRTREDYWRNLYEKQGYQMLNKGTTGPKSGSIGALASGKWTFEKVYELARNVHSIAELNKDYPYIYKLAKAKGWINMFDWFRGNEIKIEKQTIWTENTCKQEALKYKSRKEFRYACRGAYDKARELGWLEDYNWLCFPKKIVWNYDNCKKEAIKYHNRFEFQTKAYSAYKYALTNGLLNEFFPHPVRRILDYNTCKELTKQYQSVTELLKADRSLYNTILKKGWLTDFFSAENDK